MFHYRSQKGVIRIAVLVFQPWGKIRTGFAFEHYRKHILVAHWLHEAYPHSGGKPRVIGKPAFVAQKHFDRERGASEAFQIIAHRSFYIHQSLLGEHQHGGGRYCLGDGCQLEYR